MRSTIAMTASQMEAFQDAQREERQIMRAIRTALDAMDLQRKTAMLLFARELAYPGATYQTIYDCDTDEPARSLGLG